MQTQVRPTAPRRSFLWSAVAVLACLAPFHGAPGSLTGEVEKPPAATLAAKKPEPFAFADFTWLTGNSRQKESILDTKYFTGEVRVDVNYVYDLNRPKDHTLVGSSELGPSGNSKVAMTRNSGSGTYEIRLLLDDGYRSAATSAPFKVVQP